MRILYLTHDVNDPTTLKRVHMLRAGGAEISVAGFRREDAALRHLEDANVHDFGRSYPARFLHRMLLVLRTLLAVHKHRALFTDADLILARNLEMLAIAVRGRALAPTPPALVYECLDIHRLLLREDALGRVLRKLEGWLSRRATLLLTSSPAFVREYFDARSHVRLPVLLLENKVLRLEGEADPPAPVAPQKPWRIGWFGVLRCRQSFDALCDLVRAHPGLVEVTLRGRPALDQIPDFYARASITPGIHFDGAFTAHDVPRLYGDVHFAWCIDFFEEGQNSRWLLPNRLYDSGYYGAVPLALSGVETAKFLTEKNIGAVLSNITTDALAAFFTTLTATHYQHLRDEVRAIPRETWRFLPADCEAFVANLAALLPAARARYSHDVSKAPLIAIPCLNEAAHLPALLDYLLAESATQPMQIVVADGGSTDGSIEIIQRYAAAHAAIHSLANEKRIQSAAVNLAVARYGDAAEHLIRLDAHAHYPPGYIAALLDDARATQADAVVVSMHTVGASGFQAAVAAAQNSKLGNGGASHRRAAHAGKWVEHGHHALMRLAAFRAVGGYDESFTHNEDAELDRRLANAGYRVWLTANTAVDYVPRATVRGLFKQYRNFGRGRARMLRKHRLIPKPRQALPVLVLPALLLAPLWPVPALLWAAICLGYGASLALRARRRVLLLSGPAAMVMHAAWSLGFWQSFLNRARHSA